MLDPHLWFVMLIRDCLRGENFVAILTAQLHRGMVDLHSSTVISCLKSQASVQVKWKTSLLLWKRVWVVGVVCIRERMSTG